MCVYIPTPAAGTPGRTGWPSAPGRRDRTPRADPHMYVYVRMYVCIYVYMYGVSMEVCMYTSVRIHTDVYMDTSITYRKAVYIYGPSPSI